MAFCGSTDQKFTNVYPHNYVSRGRSRILEVVVHTKSQVLALDLLLANSCNSTSLSMPRNSADSTIALNSHSKVDANNASS